MKYLLKIGSVERVIDDEAITFAKQEDSFSHRGLSVSSVITFQFTEKDYNKEREQLFKAVGDWVELNKTSHLTCSYVSDILNKEILLWDNEIIFISCDTKSDPQHGLIFSLSIYGG